ncbi:MAG TPA: hypothetical protein VJ842_21010, partial [Pyrinomonadaceae bacterium]|nr:hypothetical protein [Pyrinomonadaceae bacterium]
MRAQPLRQRTSRTGKTNNRRRLSALLCVVLVAACQLSGASAAAWAQQTPRVRRAVTTSAERRESDAQGQQLDELARRAMLVTCTEREQDPQGSAPIDEMQARPSLPLRHAEVLEGVERAERLLPVAKNLAAESLRTLLRE